MKPSWFTALEAMYDATGFGWGHGMLLCTGSSILSATGLVCQRYAFLCHAGVKAEHRVIKPWVIWALGTAFLALSTLPDVLSYFAASNVMLAVLGCLQPIFVSLMAYFMLCEAFTMRDVLGSFLCVIGAVGVVAFAPKEAVANSHKFQVLPWEEPTCLGYLVVMCVLVTCLLVALLRQKASESFEGKDLENENKTREGIGANLKAVGMPFLVGAVATLGKLWNVQLAIAISDAHLSGGTWSMRWTLLGTAALMALCAVVAFVITQGGMADTAIESHVFIPSCFAFGVALNFVQAVVLKEFVGLPWWQVWASALCAAVSVCGVFVMQWQPHWQKQTPELCVDTREGRRIRTKGHQCVQRNANGPACNSYSSDAAGQSLVQRLAALRHGGPFAPPKDLLSSIDEQAPADYGAI